MFCLVGKIADDGIQICHTVFHQSLSLGIEISLSFSEVGTIINNYLYRYNDN